MSTSNLPVLGDVAVTGWKVNPYLHFEAEGIFNPHTDARLADDHRWYGRLLQLAADGKMLPELADDELRGLAEEEWLVAAGEDLDRRYHIKYVSIEAFSVCNHGCYYCPVSIAPRETVRMPTELFERIIGEVAALGQPIEGVVMNHYNEPTADSRYIDQVRFIKDAGLPVATLTNGSGLTPRRVDSLLEMGGIHYLSVNISSLDRERYKKQRGVDHLPLVLANLDYMATRPVATTMELVVLGTGDQEHRGEYERISERFAGTRFDVQFFEVNDRAGYLELGFKGESDDGCLGGCEQMGSRPINHIHISARGRCILCCQDYNERWEVGDLHTQSLQEILSGDEYARMRRWTYGLEEAPKDFLCRTCNYSVRRPASIAKPS
ncbi:MAG: radical SAM/SPASM domain-containing protein [Candidatus Aminicenantes bacterium]|nr:MAG: radical SAM/SPASM domain-containing protein [Candidatus Aminicenantes bacterium]